MLIIDKPTKTQDIFFVSQTGDNIDTIDKLKTSTGAIVFSIAESISGGYRRSSAIRVSSSSHRRSTKRCSMSRKQHKRRRSRRAK